MSRRQFDSTENTELRAKIDEAKQLLPMPSLMRRLGYDEKHIGKTALCPFHNDHHPSFSVFQKNGTWFHRCFVGCSSGDEIAFLVKHFGISRREAIRRYLEMAGFPTHAPKSREYPEPHVSPGSPASPVSEGQVLDGETDKLLKALALRNACTDGNKPEDKLWQLARDLKAVDKHRGRKLSNRERILTFNEWLRQSRLFLDPAKSHDDYFAALLAQLAKVRVPTGEGAITEALEMVAKLSDSDLPVIPGYADAPKKARLLAALHRELSRRSTQKNKIHFLSYRDAAKVCDGLSHQEAHTISFGLWELGVIEIVRKGQPGLNSREAAEFRYVLSQSENCADEDDRGFDL